MSTIENCLEIVDDANKQSWRREFLRTASHIGHDGDDVGWAANVSQRHSTHKLVGLFDRTKSQDIQVGVSFRFVNRMIFLRCCLGANNEMQHITYAVGHLIKIVERVFKILSIIYVLKM